MDLRPGSAMPRLEQASARVSLVPKDATMANVTFECDRAVAKRLAEQSRKMALGDADSETFAVRERGFTMLVHLDEIESVRASRITDRR